MCFNYRLQFILNVRLLLDKGAEDIGLSLELINLAKSKTTLSQEALEAGELLGDVTVDAPDLVKDSNVVVGILLLGSVLDGRSLVLDLLGHLGELLAVNVLGNERSKLLDGAGNVVQPAASDTVGSGLFVDKLDESLLGSAALVILGLFAACRPELDGGVAGDAQGPGPFLILRRVGVDLGNEDVLFADEVGREGLPNGSEGLAV